MSLEDQHQLGRAAAWWSNPRPGEHYALEYEGDDVAHERVAVRPDGDDHWIGYTPDGDLYAEDPRCRDPATGACRSYKWAGPGRQAPGASLLPLYAFRGEIDRERLKSLAIEAREQARDDGLDLVVPTTVSVSGEQLSMRELLGEPSRRLGAKQATSGPRRPAATAAERPPAARRGGSTTERQLN